MGSARTHVGERITSDELAAARKNPHNPEHPETIRSCLHVILEEEWEHHRYAVRDLDAIAATRLVHVDRSS